MMLYFANSGQHLWIRGAPYGTFAGAVDACAAKAPQMRGRTPAACDLAFQWLKEEPHTHQLAMPGIVLIAFVTFALLWDWCRVAALLLAGRCGLLRPAEFLCARRRDLVLPEDCQFTVPYALVVIPAPKTRNTGARVQSARIVPQDAEKLLAAVFGRLRPGEALWPASAAIFQARFKTLSRTLGLPVDAAGPTDLRL